MGKRHNSFRAEHEGLSPYAMWVLCGFIFNGKLIDDRQDEKHYILMMEDKKEKIPIKVVNILYSRGLLSFNHRNSRFYITTEGFSVASARLRESQYPIRNINTYDIDWDRGFSSENI